MEITTADGSTSALFEVQDEVANATPAKSEPIFNKCGSRYFLAKLFDECNPNGSRVVKSHRHPAMTRRVRASFEDKLAASRSLWNTWRNKTRWQRHTGVTTAIHDSTSLPTSNVEKAATTLGQVLAPTIHAGDHDRTGELALQKTLQLIVDATRSMEPEPVPVVIFLYGDYSGMDNRRPITSLTSYWKTRR
jgi:hypothetical protein